MPRRTCVGCRTTAEKSELVRIVHDGVRFVLDGRQIAPGRGAYLHPGCGARALRTRALTRALRVPGSPAQLAELMADIDATAFAPPDAPDALAMPNAAASLVGPDAAARPA